MEPDAQERFAEFLAVAPQVGTPDEDDSGQLALDELDEHEDE